MARIMRPQEGDVLVEKGTARLQHEVSVVADPGVSAVCANQKLAVTQAEELARERRVDAWLTEDHIHFIRIAAHRPGH